jgi:hypothetical protein
VTRRKGQKVREALLITVLAGPWEGTGGPSSQPRIEVWAVDPLIKVLDALTPGSRRVRWTLDRNGSPRIVVRARLQSKLTVEVSALRPRPETGREAHFSAAFQSEGTIGTAGASASQAPAESRTRFRESSRPSANREPAGG